MHKKRVKVQDFSSALLIQTKSYRFYWIGRFLSMYSDVIRACY